MPEKFKNWKYLIPKQETKPFKIEKGMTSLDIQLASSRGMDINVLSLDEKTVMVNNRAKNVIKTLESNNFEVIRIELDNCEIFGGGIHCSTLDLVRDDKLIDYTK